MSGQRQQSFDLTPTKQPHVGSMADAPQFGTTPYQATAARFVNDGRGMAAIGSALSSFFDAGAKTAETVAQIQHREEMVQIKRENEALAKQGIADQKLGKPLDPANAERRDYFEAYQTSAADAQAHQLSEGLREHLAAQPLDGSVDLAQVAQDYYRKEVGTGTGDPTYDARMLSQFSRAAEAQVSQFAEARRSTVIQNTTQATIEQFTQRVLSPEGISTPQFAEARNRLLPLVHGNTAMRDKLMLAAISGAVQNDGQGLGVLRAMQELGLDKSEPAAYNRISGEVLKRTNAIKTYDAGLAVQTFQQDMALEKRKYPQGILPPEKVAEFARRAYGIDSAHGTGLEVFGLNAEFARSVVQQTQTNMFKAIATGAYGTMNAADVLAAHGMPTSAVLEKGFDAGMADVVTELSRSNPGLAPLVATKNAVGLLEPMASDQAAVAMARVQLNPLIRKASLDSMSPRMKEHFGRPLVGKDPAAALRAHTYYRTLQEGGMSREELHRYFPDSATENRFYAISAFNQSPMGQRTAIQSLIDNPYDADTFADALKTGKPNLAAVAKRFGASGNAADIDATIAKQRTASILESTDRQRWFKGYTVSMDSNEEVAHDLRVLEQLYVQRVSRGTVDVEQAVEAATQNGRFILVPGMNGNLQAVRDPFKGAGQVMGQPLNNGPDHPFSTAKGFSPIYAPGARLSNARGEPEDTLVTWAEDAREAHRLFPGMIAEHEELYLNRPNAAGLSQVRKSNGAPVVFRPGQPIALRVGPEALWDSMFPVTSGNPRGLASTTVPRDPEEAKMFFRARLPAGWFAVAEGGNYVMYYGSRLKYGEREMQEAIARRGQQWPKDREADKAVTGTYNLESGAAMRFAHPTGSRSAAQGSQGDTSNNGPSWGDVGNAIAGAGRSAVGLVVNAGGAVADGANYVWKGVGGPGRVQRVKGAFASEPDQ